jgi:hypothetical protein
MVAPPVRTLSAMDDPIYDACLVEKTGNTVACDAMMRIIDRGKRDLYRAAGFSDQEIDEHLRALRVRRSAE